LLQKHSRKELPPLREVPSAKPWRGKELRRSGLEKAGWSMVAVTAVVFTVGMMNRDRFRHTPDLGWTTGHKALWQDQYQLAQDSWKVGDYARCAGYCRVALDFGDPRIAEKGPVYALAASAYLKDGDLRGAHKVISDYDKRGPHTAALDAEIKSDRDGLGAQGQTEVERDLNQGWQAASGGDDSAAGKQLKSAQDLAVLLGLGDPAVSDCVKLKQELSRREQALNARLEAEARQHRDMRVRADGEQAHDRALEQAMRHGTVESFPFQPPPPPPTGWRSRLHGGGNDVTTTDEERSLHHHHPISVQAMFPPFTPPVAPQATQFNRRGAPQNPVMLR
jgi:hypothetical protein